MISKLTSRCFYYYCFFWNKTKEVIRDAIN